MRKLVATFALAVSLCGVGTALAPSASAGMTEDDVREGAVLVYKLTRLIF